MAEVQILFEEVRAKREEAGRLKQQAEEAKEKEENLADKADRLDVESETIKVELIPNIEDDIRLTEILIADKDEEIREADEEIDIHKNAAVRHWQQEQEKRLDAADKYKESDRLKSQADTQVVIGLPQRSMGFLAESRPRFERAAELQIRGQQLQREADELIRSARESESHYNQVLCRGIYLASERGSFRRELSTLHSQLEGYKTELRKAKDDAQQKRNYCLRIREEELKLSDESLDLEEKANSVTAQAEVLELQINQQMAVVGQCQKGSGDK